MKKNILYHYLLWGFLTMHTLYADEITQGINEALKAYEEKDYTGAIDALTYVTATLNSLEAKENQKLLPPPLEGWRLETKKKNQQQQAMMAMLGGGASIKGTYIKEQARVQIEITSNSPIAAMLSMGINNPMLITAEPGTKSFRYKKSKGVRIKKRDENKIMLMLPGNIVLQLTGEHLKDDTVLDQYLEKIDFKQIKEKLL